MDTVMNFMPTALTGLGGLVVVLKVVAPMTHTEWDNRLLKYLSLAVEFLGRMVSPKLPPR